MELSPENRLPAAQGKYIPATRCGDIVYTAGMTPRKDGELLFKGKIKASEPLEKYKEAVRLAAANALNAARAVLIGKEEKLKILNMNVFIAACSDFEEHAKLADYASEYLYQVLGDSGIGSRTTVGVFSLPGRAPLEIQLTAAIIHLLD